MSTNPNDLASEIFAHLEKAWNAADGMAFGEPFAAETDFVDIRGTHHHGSAHDVGQGHQALFASIYKDSQVRYRVTHAREIGTGCVVAHAVATLDAPTGPLQGTHTSTATAVIVGRGDDARITAFQNTLIAS